MAKDPESMIPCLLRGGTGPLYAVCGADPWGRSISWISTEMTNTHVI